MEELVSDMVERLDQMRDGQCWLSFLRCRFTGCLLTSAILTEELSVREQFFVEQGPFLPDDLCPFVGDQPGRWAVTVGDETLLDLQESVLAEVRLDMLK